MQDYDTDIGLRASAQPALMLETHTLYCYGTNLTATFRCARSNFHLCLLGFTEPTRFASLPNILSFHLLHFSLGYFSQCLIYAALHLRLCFGTIFLWRSVSAIFATSSG